MKTAVHNEYRKDRAESPAKKPPFFSVILPSYNRYKRTACAILSVWAQSFLDYELIVIDDGSDLLLEDSTFFSSLSHTRSWSTREVEVQIFTEKKLSQTLEQCRDQKLQKKLSPANTLTLLRIKNNKGVAAARNLGHRYALGTWLAFLDSDDFWHPQKLAAQACYSSEHPHFNIHQCQEKWIRANKRVNPIKRHIKTGGDLFAASVKACVITPSAVVIKRSLLDEVGPFDETLHVCEDFELWLRITCRYPVGLCDEVGLTRYQMPRHESDQLSLTTPMLDVFRIRALMKFIDKSGDRKQKALAYKQFLRKWKIVARGARKHRKWLFLCTLARWYLWGKLQALRLSPHSLSEEKE